jgi:hypothetical protein
MTGGIDVEDALHAWPHCNRIFIFHVIFTAAGKHLHEHFRIDKRMALKITVLIECVQQGLCTVLKPFIT